MSPPPAASPSVTSTTERLGSLHLHGEGNASNLGPAAVTDGSFLNKPSEETKRTYKYAKYLPVFEAGAKYPPLEPFEHRDPGLNVEDPVNNPLPNLLGKATEVSELTPSIGSEVTGVQVSQLDDAGKNELAAFVARRGVVVFRDQDFKDQDLDKAKDFAKYFGRLHIHPTSGHPENHPEIHLVYRDADSTFNFEQSNRISSVTWHSDVSYEQQPPGTTFLYILDQPPTGGDTLFASQVEAYNRLSPEFKKRLEGLKVLHSGVEQAEFSRSEKRGGVVRREPVENIHPLVRTHPVTKQKALYVQPQFARHIVGFRREESDYLLNFLYDHIAKGSDFHVRVKWSKGTLVAWDNRVTAHTALLDFTGGHRRHAARLTPQAERPFYE